MQLELVLRQDFQAFDGQAQDRFLSTIASISGSDKELLRILEMRPGCVTIVIEIDEAAADKLLLAIERYKKSYFELAPDQQVSLGILFNDLGLMLPPKVIQSDAKVDKLSKVPQKNIIFFVHGWRGGPMSFGELPRYIEEETGCDCRSFIYPSGFLEYSSSISFVARALDNWVRNELRGKDVSFGVVAHSMGGVVVRDFLGSQNMSSRPLNKLVRQVTFVASPQTGAWLAKIAGLLPSSAAAQASELSPNSQYLGRTNAIWNSWVAKQRHLDGNVRSIFSSSDEIVDHVSAMGADPEAVPILNAGHSDIVKPSSNTSEIVRTIARFMDESGLTATHRLAS